MDYLNSRHDTSGASVEGRRILGSPLW